MNKKLFFKKPFFPAHQDNLMGHEGDVSTARQSFLDSRFTNLDFLLSSRYSWMNDYLSDQQKIVEIGAGAGFSSLYLKSKVTLTDAADNPWIDEYIDALEINYPDNSIDVIIASHTIHHFSNPAKFFFECQRVLKKDGLILISEINTSFLMRGLLRVLHHEGYSYDVDLFNTESVVNDPSDLWSANCAVPEMLFSQPKVFSNYFKHLKIDRNELCECSIFPLSGGVISKTKVPRLPIALLRVMSFIDRLLIKLAPSVFALGRRVVLQKI
jgi:SAM-dependent methyltransferase